MSTAGIGRCSVFESARPLPSELIKHYPVGRSFNHRYPRAVPTEKRSVRVSDQFTRRIHDMNISTSYISECDVEEDSPVTANRPQPVHVPEIQRPSVPNFGSACREAPLPRVDVRQSVLETIGDLLDGSLISPEEASSAITLAMSPDATFERIDILLRSRKSLDGKGAFLRLWLRGRGVECEPSPIPVHAAPCRTLSDELDADRRLVRSQSNLRLEFVPSASPPLVPLSLNFGSPSEFHTERYNNLRLVKIVGGHSTPSTMSPSPELGMDMMNRFTSQKSDDFN